MDPDPLSLFGIYLSTQVLTLTNSLFFLILIVLFISLILLFFLGMLEKSLREITDEELIQLQKNHKSQFDKLKLLFQNVGSISTLMWWSRLFWSVLGVICIIVILYPYVLQPTITILVAMIVVILLAWVMPSFLFKNSVSSLHLGLRYSLWFLNMNNNLAIYLAPLAPELPTEDVSLEDLKTALPESDQKTPSIANLNLYKQVLRFDKIIIKNVMRPKKEIVGINANYNFKEVLAKIKSSSFSRLPVYDREWKNIQGIIHCKDLLPFTSSEKLNWSKYIRSIMFVQENDLAHAVLRLFQKSKNHMAIVQNAEMQIVGIVTLEDITEEIIGEIEDE